MSKKAVSNEIDKFLDSDEASEALFFLSEEEEITETMAFMIIGEDEEPFSITYSKNYPKDKETGFKFESSSDSDVMVQWLKDVNSWCQKNKSKTLEAALSWAADRYLEILNEEEEPDLHETEKTDVLDSKGHSFEAPKPKKVQDEVDKMVDSKKFLQIGSGPATMRLVQDLKNILRLNSKEMGFTAEPVKDSQGLENLYHWHIKLFNFEKGSGIAQDMEKFKKKTGQDHILLEARFGAEYPFVPPFVRVIKPRFAFRTGHVTMGGSICMELLTMSGWNSTNDIESILIQIRCEMLGGGARLDEGQNNYEYSPSEAWDAFFRAASTHGWSVKGLGPDMFKFQPDYKH